LSPDRSRKTRHLLSLAGALMTTCFKLNTLLQAHQKAVIDRLDLRFAQVMPQQMQTAPLRGHGAIVTNALEGKLGAIFAQFTIH
jgi:hypothetical protein